MRRLAPLLALTLALALAALAPACDLGFVPVTYVQGLRVLAVRADPPEIAPGETTTMTLLAVDTDGSPITATWEACLIPSSYTTAVNPRCLTSDAGTDFQPLGDGLTAALTMPTVSPVDLGIPDSTGGFYFPVRVDVAAGGAVIPTIYRVRYSLGLTTPNQNPTLTGVYMVPGGVPNATLPQDQLIPLDEANPPDVHDGDKLILRGLFSDGSAETYPVPDGDPRLGKTKDVTEILRTFWYATAGDFNDPVTGGEKPDTTLTLTKRLPTPGPDGTIIDLWVVGREERGGIDWQHRTLRLR